MCPQRIGRQNLPQVLRHEQRSCDGKILRRCSEIPRQRRQSRNAKSVRPGRSYGAGSAGRLRSTCTYVRARTLKALSKCSTFVKVTQQINEVYRKAEGGGQTMRGYSLTAIPVRPAPSRTAAARTCLVSDHHRRRRAVETRSFQCPSQFE